MSNYKAIADGLETVAGAYVKAAECIRGLLAKNKRLHRDNQALQSLIMKLERENANIRLRVGMVVLEANSGKKSGRRSKDANSVSQEAPQAESSSERNEQQESKGVLYR